MAGSTRFMPYKGAPQGITAVMSERPVTMGFFQYAHVISQIRDGRLKALAAHEQDPYAVLSCRADARRIGIEGYEVTVWFRIRGPGRTAGLRPGAPLRRNRKDHERSRRCVKS